MIDNVTESDSINKKQSHCDSSKDHRTVMQRMYVMGHERQYLRPQPGELFQHWLQQRALKVS